MLKWSVALIVTPLQIERVIRLTAATLFRSTLDHHRLTVNMTKPESLEAASYRLPTRGILAYLPATWVPYAELMRLNKPVGTLNIYIPYLFGNLFAACVLGATTRPRDLISSCVMMFLAAFVLRSLGCTWNDIIDRDLDKHVRRCRLRPMARGAVSTTKAYTFCVAQLVVWLGILWQTGVATFLCALPVVPLAAMYPFAKRLTSYPQVLLGVTLSWGVLVGTTSLKLSPENLLRYDMKAAAALASLFLSYMTWTILHDTVYAFQDIKDDKKAGIKSMSVRYENHAGLLLSALSVLQIGTLWTTGVLLSASFAYFLGTCGSIGLMLILLIWRLDTKDPQKCLWWFQYGSLAFGLITSAGLIQECLQRSLVLRKFLAD